MIDTIAFQTKARTVDHLGREQIADTPTAISELWKNSFDAYARKVALDIYDGNEPVAVITDNGHGMSREEFETRWLVVGTESKATGSVTPFSDRNGLRPRPRQGQKGIGRLSCANLGPLLLLVSKRTAEPFVAALVDWRLFENPFLNLSDIRIPVTNFEVMEDLFEVLPELRSGLAQNLTGSRDDEMRSNRLREAWHAYDELHGVEPDGEPQSQRRAPSEAILEEVAGFEFQERHISNWGVWTGEDNHGTALFISNINYDLLAELDVVEDDASARSSRRRFFETLSSFVDPFVDPTERGSAASQLEFEYAVRAWRGESPKLIVGSEKQFDRRTLDDMEHLLVGSIDADGVFRGRVKAFGHWVDEACVIEPPNDLIIPRRLDTAVGPFGLYIASMEFQASATSLPRLQFQQFQELAAQYSGFMIFRDGLRVLPYGREDNDFFEIEMRRSKNVGREFWNHRQMFGRLSISRQDNPNLKDKAGREGILDNRAAKTLKELVSNVLRTSARRYFGSASEYRKEILPQVKEENKAEKAAEARNKLRQRQRREFRTKLMSCSRDLPLLNQEMENYAQNLSLRNDSEIVNAQQQLDDFRERLSSFRLPGAPKNLGALEETFADCRDGLRTAGVLISTISQGIDQGVERISPAQPRTLLERQLARHAAQMHHRIQLWKRTIDVLQRGEAERIRELVKQRNKSFHAEATPLLARFDRGELTYAEASRALERMKDLMDTENVELFEPYIGALESLRESIDLEGLAAFGMEELGDLRTELERLNGLAQLGIAVEIVGHELQAYDDIMGSALRRLPEAVRESRAVKDLEFGYDGLTDQLRFLSPLRLAGQRIQRWITGKEIHDYLAEFF